jgi:ribose/xylose/arabinose/galactoside ABC-type transport system permease subunit
MSRDLALDTDEVGLPVNPLVKLVTRLVAAQAGADAAIGLCYSRRHLPSIIITLMLVVAVLGLAVIVRSGTHAAWVVALGFESAFVMFGIVRFITSRYVGGTLMALIATGVLLHPAVARAFNREAERGFSGEPALGEAGADAFGGGASG